MICKGITKAGKACKFPTDSENGLCLNCDPARADEMRQRNAERAVAGGRAAHAHAQGRQADRDAAAAAATIRTIEGQLAALDAALREVLRSKIDAAKKASAVSTIVKTARDVLMSSQLEKENAELYRILLEQHPELAQHMKKLRAV